MTNRKRSERQRWVKVYSVYLPPSDHNEACTRYRELAAVVKAFADVGRVVRLEPLKFGNGLLLKARRA